MARWRRGGGGLAALALMLLTVGCGGGGPEEPPATDRPTPTEEPTAPTPAEPTTGGPRGEVTAEEAAQLAVADLTERLGVDAADVEVVSAAQVTWPDGSLGCPEPGMAYTQALTEGTRVELSVDGEDYAYHSGAGQAPFLCADPQPPLDQAESS